MKIRIFIQVLFFIAALILFEKIEAAKLRISFYLAYYSIAVLTWFFGEFKKNDDQDNNDEELEEGPPDIPSEFREKVRVLEEEYI